MEREYIKIRKPVSLFPISSNILRNLDDEFWKEWICFHLLSFYQKYEILALQQLINNEKEKEFPKIEKTIATYIRKWLNNDPDFSSHFRAFGENTNDEEMEGYYDITIHNTYWKNGDFHFECKKLDDKQGLVNQYVYYPRKKGIYDGGVYRFFNGKYAQKQNFGGVIGFVLAGDIQAIRRGLIETIEKHFSTSIDGQILRAELNSIDDNDFTFTSVHNRLNSEFTLYHILFNFS